MLVAHAWRGLDDFAKNKAEELANLGYVAMALDNYGEGKISSNDEESAALMHPLFIDRALLRERLNAGLEAAKRLPGVDQKHIGAIGFCFGGLAVQELAKSGAEISGIVSFHGLLGSTVGSAKAKLEKNAAKIKAKMLILHGHDDPMVSADDISHFQQEMTQAKVDWQMHIYGGTSHAFTNPIAQDASSGMFYNPVAAKRAWQSMRNFFEEIFA